jgi:predicted nicotinamide N-methyase
MSALSELLASGLPSESASAQQKAFVTYLYNRSSTGDDDSTERSVTLLESRSIISSSGTTGLRTWEAALFLGEYLSSEPGQSLIQGKKVFELGAGTGMLSILCAKHLGVSGIVATDGDEAVVDAIKTNMFLNGLDADESSGSRVKFRTAALKWGRSIDSTSFEEDYGMGVPDVLLGADVTYDKSVIPSLVSTLRQFFELNQSLQVIICATIRNEETVKAFQNTCSRNRFHLESINFEPVAEELQDGPFYPTGTRIQIWRIIRSEPPHDHFSI